MEDIIAGFSQFHFLRPEFLSLLLLLPLLWWLLLRHQDQGNDWSRAIDPALLAYMTQAKPRQKKQRRNWLPLLTLVLISLGLSGPAWQQKPQPVGQIKDDLVVILDLSISMLATDTSPDRLTRAKQKLHDLLALRREGNTALIVFSGDSHVVTPLTDDTNTIAANLPALDPFMMPVIGSRPDIAVTQARDLLKQGLSTAGRIVMLTDGIEGHQATRIRETLDGENIALSILAVGTELGGPIDLKDRGYLKDQGSVVIPKTDFSQLSGIAVDNGGYFASMSLDDNDLEALDISGSRQINARNQNPESVIDQRFDRWEDAGYLFLLAIIPLVLLAHRQGAFLLVLIFLLPGHDSFADEAPGDTPDQPSANLQNIATSTEQMPPPGARTPSLWQDLWQTRDQQAQALMDSQNFEAATERFESNEHKAYAQYKSGQYEQSAALLEPGDDPTDSRTLYNRGNALAQQMKFEEAIEAYSKALEQDPDNEDAQFNRRLLEDFLKQQEEQQQNQEGGEQQEQNQSRNDSQEGQQGDQGQDQEHSPDSQQESQQGSQQEPQQGSQGQEDQEGQANQQEQGQESEQQSESDAQEAAEAQQTEDAAEDEASQAEGSATMDELSAEERQSFEQWMRRVPDDPGGLLRRKFEQQSRERQREKREEGEPLW